MSQKVDSITVRMYNTGSVGDCILLLFKKGTQVTFSVLIDCGGYMTKASLIQQCVKDIRKNIVDDTLDLVIVTHEHLDHVSGFNQARSIFDEITFRQVWMSWAEDSTDPVAKKLKKEKGKKIAALKNLVAKNLKKLKSRSANQSYERLARSLKKRTQIRGVTLGALGFESGEIPKGVGMMPLNNGQAMSYVLSKSQVKAKGKIYKNPGDVIEELPGAEGIRFHILGPPKESSLAGIKVLTKKDEMYSLKSNMNLLGSAFLTNVDQKNNLQLKSPFHPKFEMTKRKHRKETQAFEKFYNANEWRQIEEDWLDVTEQLAIAVNSYTNNTSLALAIEMVGSEQVLLFPADAQSGNWMSWHSEEVSKLLLKNGGKTAEKLLNDTVFYKVGHHGSHNGTASKSGLEKMKSKKLVAFMPLVQDKIPSQWGGAKNFPAKALYKKLIELTNGAVIRTDEGLITDGGAATRRDQYLSIAMANALKKNKARALVQEWVVK